MASRKNIFKVLFNICKLYKNLTWLDKNVWLSDQIVDGYQNVYLWICFVLFKFFFIY